MAFDSDTRRLLAGFVSAARGLLQSEFAVLLPSTFGIRLDGTLDPVESLSGLDEQGLQLAETLRERITYLAVSLSTEKTDAAKTKWAVDQLAREQAFTVLNRLAAIRMAEKRGIVQESVAKGFQSKAFRVFENLAGNSLGETFPKYRQFLNCLFDELAVDLGLLFDRNTPQGLLFPRETAFLKLLELFNDRDLENLWAEDETVGWIYQYYNDPAERKEMRDKSAAPRNSRELAVRNQFFTPRYVVEFLTDNTLGRIWYEMCQGQTSLKDRCRYLVRRPNELFLKESEAAPEQPQQENLSQEELLKQTVYIPHRQLKDPRTILMLDPACGSMHFGLYAFDLFEEIYHEAWDREEQNPGALLRSTGMKSLHQSYADKTQFLADIPRLIIEQNIHGVDIDPRATQIAALSLWLRAHRTWNDQKTPLAQRPRITKSHIVCAEPMPGDPALLQEFVKTSFPVNEHSLFQRLLEQIFVKMQLAGEAGSLLKIEEEITSAVEEAKVAWAKSRSASKELFGTAELNAAKKPGSQADLLGLDTALLALDVTTDFWESIEERIYAALRDYAEQAETSAGFQQRLFAEDAARGFAFIDVCRKRYDVALMNPPFGDSSQATFSYLESRYVHWSGNLLCAFIERTFQLTDKTGCIGVIFDRTALIKSSYENFRRAHLVADNRLRFLLDLGWNVLDANVEVTSCVISKVKGPGVFIDIRGHAPDAKGQSLLEQLKGYGSGAEAKITEVDGEHFLQYPNAVVGYDFPRFLRLAFAEEKPLIDIGFCAYWGHSLKAEVHYRVWWENLYHKRGELPGRLFNGAGFAPYKTTQYGAVVSKVPIEHLPQNSSTALRNHDHQLKKGVCFGKRGEFFTAHVLPEGFYFTQEGQSFPIEDENDALALLGFLNTPIVRYAINRYCGQHKTSGYVNLLPFKRFPDSARVTSAVRKTVSLVTEAERNDELSPFFVPMAAHSDSLKMTAGKLGAIVQNAIARVSECSALCESFLENLYGLSIGERDAVQAFEAGQPKVQLPLLDLDGVDDLPIFTSQTTISVIIGYLIGRWDIRYATGEQAAPELPDPFAPLPVCPPGQLQNAQGLPARPEDVPAAYPVRIPWDGILVDDPNHPLDIERRVREVIEIIWSGKEGGLTAEAIEHEACEILGLNSLRDYFRKPAGFFADHLKRYSKSRRQAPIYWPLSTSKGNYTLWIYYHRLTDQTLHTALLDFVEPKLKTVATEINHLRETNAARDRLADLLDFQDELKEFEMEIKRIIDLPWKPNLNDGVKITASPLWKLFRFPKWQKDLKATWQELEEGGYDWAHVAYSIWPARVEEKCKSDRSTAIAHGLEHLCPVEAPKSKRGRKTKSLETEDNDLYPTEDEGTESSKESPRPKNVGRQAKINLIGSDLPTPKRRGRPPKNPPTGN